MDELTREDIQNIQSVMNSSVVNKQERKCKIAYWNDEDGAYKDATVYIPDTQFKIKRVDRKKENNLLQFNQDRTDRILNQGAWVSQLMCSLFYIWEDRYGNIHV